MHSNLTKNPTESPTESPTVTKSFSAKTKSHPLLNPLKGVMALMVLGLCGWGGWTLYQQNVVVPETKAKHLQNTVSVQRQNLTVTVMANGTVQPQLSVNVSPKNSGILKQLFVKEGDRVQKGQLLAKMDDSNLQGQLLQSQGQVTQAQANLAKLKAGNRPQDIAQAQAELGQAQATLDKLKAGNRPQDIAQAQAELGQAQANLQKLKRGNRPQDIAQAQARLENALSNQRQAELVFLQNRSLNEAGAIAARDWENSRTQKDNAAAQVREAKQALALQKAGSRPEEIQQAAEVVAQKQAALSLIKSGSRAEDIAQAQAQVAIAQGNLKTVQTQIQDTEIRAPFDGIVARKYADPGAFVTPTTAGSAVSSATSSSILALAARNQIVTNVSESNIAQMSLGQKSLIKADAYPNKTFIGKVIQIAPQSIVQQNVTSFEVKVAILNDPQNLLRSGMNVRVEFAAGQVKNVLVVPTVAIVRQEEGTGVYLWKNNQAEFVPIKTGLTVNDKTEIRSGLQEKDRILITFPDGKRPRSKVPGSPGMPGLGGGSR